MHERDCKNCGKKMLIGAWSNQLYCSDQCRKQFKKKRLAEQKPQLLSLTKTPSEQCRKCQFGHMMGGFLGCGYIFIQGHSRHSLHPGGLPDECQEFQCRRRGRRSAPLAK